MKVFKLFYLEIRKIKKQLFANFIIGDVGQPGKLSPLGGDDPGSNPGIPILMDLNTEKIFDFQGDQEPGVLDIQSNSSNSLSLRFLRTCRNPGSPTS